MDCQASQPRRGTYEREELEGSGGFSKIKCAPNSCILLFRAVGSGYQTTQQPLSRLCTAKLQMACADRMCLSLFNPFW